MSKKITIAIDAMGGDNSPKKTIEGLGIFLNKNKSKDDFKIHLYGDKNILTNEISKINSGKDKIQIIHTSETVSDKESPMTAVKNSKNTSMWNAVKAQIDGDADITLSAGNTGVLLVISRMILKMIKEVNKPALAGLWPSKKGMSVVVDLGANIECDENNLIDFSEMGAALFRSIFPNERPKISLLNIGSEEIKGTDMLKKAYSKLTKLNKGNIALKTAEGTAKFITDNLKKSLSENFFSKFSLLFSYFSLKKFKSKLDPRKYNGAIFLGLNGPVVKSHGGTDAVGFYHSIDLCYRIVKGNLMNEIKNNLKHLDVEV